MEGEGRVSLSNALDENITDGQITTNTEICFS